MIFPRYEKYHGHLVSAIPSHYVCAECGGRLVLHPHGSEESKILCAQNQEHFHIVSLDLYSKIKRAGQEEKAKAAVAQVQHLSKLNPEARRVYLDLTREIEHLLFGQSRR